ncbi:MAG: efflux RND transporter periplasmic adaptor subunit [Bacteroidetes bacterium]|nr:efflux RND transporter periplasmic adaptor subunit [Bacteroidota bacterium]
MNRADSAKLAIISSENDLKFDAVRIDKGIYQISAKFPEQKSYALNITINSKLGADLIQIKDIKVGEKLPVAEATHSDESFFKSYGIWIGAGLLGGIILTLIITRKRKINPTATILLCITLMIPANIETISAHEGHDDNAKGNNFSGNFIVPKETQFLFNIYTQKIKSGDFTETINLFGTVIPASNGRATVQSPQSGKINTVNVRVGQTVSQGDILAILEQSIDASSQVDLLTQKNALDEELVAAKKEYDRLQTIKDIVSKKELDEADARYNTALENKKVFDNLNAGNASNSKLIYLKSPINGSS